MSRVTSASSPRAKYVDKTVAAEFLGVGVRTIEKWTQLRRIPFVRLSNRCVRYDLQELEAMMQRLSTPLGGVGAKADNSDA